MTGSVDQLVSTGRLERIPADPTRAQAMLAEARQHLKSAKAIAGDDPNGAYQLLYDAARKALWAHMLAFGYRPANAPGAHATAPAYATAALAEVPSAAAFDRLRRSRNRSEYGSAHFSASAIQVDLDHAQAIVRAVELQLGAG